VADYEPEGLDVLMRLYYPTHERPPARWRRPLWVPTLAYSHGMMHFLFDFGDPKRSWWQRLLARAAYIGGHVATTLFDTLPVKENAVPRSEKTMPVVIFSHGLAGTRNMYAALCTSLASQGFLVAALEHRDGSASCASRSAAAAADPVAANAAAAAVLEAAEAGTAAAAVLEATCPRTRR